MKNTLHLYLLCETMVQTDKESWLSVDTDGKPGSGRYNYKGGKEMKVKKEKLWVGRFNFDEVILVDQSKDSYAWDIIVRVEDRWFFMEDFYVWEDDSASRRSKTKTFIKRYVLHVWVSKHYGHVMCVESRSWKTQATEYTPKFKCYSSITEIQKELVTKQLLEEVI